jgi:putative flippase GtrA
MLEFARKIYREHRELVVYGFFGGLTTLVNFIVFAVADAFLLSVTSSTAIAWVAAVSFAFFTNRKWVFRSEKKGALNILGEGIAFFSVRAGTFFMDIGVMWLFVDYLGFDHRLQRYGFKILASIFVIIANYVLSKFVVFKKK